MNLDKTRPSTLYKNARIYTNDRKHVGSAMLYVATKNFSSSGDEGRSLRPRRKGELGVVDLSGHFVMPAFNGTSTSILAARPRLRSLFDSTAARPSPKSKKRLAPPSRANKPERNGSPARRWGINTFGPEKRSYRPDPTRFAQQSRVPSVTSPATLP